MTEREAKRLLKKSVSWGMFHPRVHPVYVWRDVWYAKGLIEGLKRRKKK